MTGSGQNQVQERDIKAGHIKILLAFSVAVLLVISCSVLASPATQPPPATATAPPLPSETPAPTLASTSTPAPASPSILISTAALCRGGPGDEYELVAELQSGDEAEVVGQSDGFWVVKTSAGPVCWVADQGVIPSGEVASVPEVEAPPIPTPAPPAAPANLEAFNAACYTDKSYTPNKRVNRFHLYWQDLANNEDGFYVYRDGNLVAKLPPDKTEVIDEIISQNDRVHTYYVVAYNAVGESKSEVIALTCQGSGGGGGDYNPG